MSGSPYNITTGRDDNGKPRVHMGVDSKSGLVVFDENGRVLRHPP